MKSISNTPSRRLASLVPDELKGRDYVKPSVGDVYTIDKIVYSVYPARDKVTHEIITSQKGNTIYRVTAYIGFDGDKYATSNADVVIDQLVTETGTFDDHTEGYYAFNADCKVKIATASRTYGKGDTAKQVPIWAFAPLD